MVLVRFILCVTDGKDLRNGQYITPFTSVNAVVFSLQHNHDYYLLVFHRQGVVYDRSTVLKKQTCNEFDQFDLDETNQSYFLERF